MFYHGLPSLQTEILLKNLGINLKMAVHSRQPSTLVDLVQVYHEEWAKITPERTQRGWRWLGRTYSAVKKYLPPSRFPTLLHTCHT